MCRLALSHHDLEARKWFRERAIQRRCQVVVDAIGNQFAIRPGRREGPPTFMGSHLDTQPTGGRYDGILGVCAGLEALTVLDDTKTETEFPVGVINWTNEEGARFAKSMMGSGVWAGHIGLEDALKLREVGGGDARLGEELQKFTEQEKSVGISAVPATPEAVPLGAHFELHIEQGPRLQNARKKIGVVTGVQSYKWFDCKVIGRDSHTGTTPFDARVDALLAAASFVQTSNRQAREKGALASTGIFRAFPGSVNTVPGM